MSDDAPKKKSKGRLLLLLQIVISVALMVWLCSQIELHDKIELTPAAAKARGFEIVRGKIEEPNADPLVLKTREGKLLEISRDEIQRGPDTVELVAEGSEKLTGRVDRAAWEADGPARLTTPEGQREIARGGIKEVVFGKLSGLEYGFLPTLGRVTGVYLLLGLLSLICGHLLSVVRWRMLLRSQGMMVTFWQVLRWTYIGVFFNNVMPGTTGGDVIKAVFVGRECHDTTRAVVSVFVDRIIGISSLALLAGLVCTMRLHDPRYLDAALGIYGVLACLLGGATVYFSTWIRRLIYFDALVAKLPIGGLIAKVDDAALIYRDHKGMIAVAVLISLGVHSCLVMSVMLFGYALGGELLNVNAVDFFVLTPIVQILMALPIAVQGWGVGEVAFREAFKRVGVPAVQMLALSLLNRLMIMLFSLGGGLFLLGGARVPSEDEVEAFEEEAEEHLDGVAPPPLPEGDEPSPPADTATSAPPTEAGQAP